ncbi:MAG: T9SS type A sorting domain-containing protein [Bacteroidales bacterium]
MKTLTIFVVITFLVNPLFSQPKTPEEFTIANTWYDIQTTRSMQDRIYYFDDGTIGAVFNLMYTDDLGVGYNYYDGNSWGPEPMYPITTSPSLNPSYTKFGENGEIVASEGSNGLYINYRTEKGTGDWNQIVFPGPVSCTKLYSPQIVTAGTDYHIIHILALCKDTSQQLEYQDNIGKVLYSRTSDGGTTWDVLHHNFDFNNDYFGFSELSLVFAEPKENTLAFAIGDYFTDLILVKSLDGGDTWQETIIWEHPYPYLEFGTTVTDTFWANTGSMDIALDLELRANVVFSLCHIQSLSDSIWYNDPWADGIVYWNEDMDVFSNNINALNPQDQPDSELYEDYNLIGWIQDLNGNGEPDFLPFDNDNPAFYPSLGLSTMPTLYIDPYNGIFVIWSSLTETFNNGNNDYRHIWARHGNFDNSTWGNFVDFTSELIHIFDECVFPTISPQNDDYLHLTYQFDQEPGLNNSGISGNEIICMKVGLEIPPASVLANFTSNATLVHPGDTVLFLNLSTGYPPDMLEFEWEFDGGIPSFSTDTNPSVIYLNEGTYDVKLTASIGNLTSNTKLIEDYITVLPQTSLTEILMADFVTISPNPSTGIVSVSNDHEEDINVTNYGPVGNLIGTEKIEKEKSKSLNLLDSPNGIYIIKIESGNSVYTEKIILKKE